MPGVFNLSVDEAVKEVRATRALGVLSVILFGLPEKKDEVATGAWAEDGIVQKAARAIKREVRDVLVMGDVCLCEYMSHGHCGIVKAAPQSLGAAAAAPPATAEYEIVNDASLELLARTSVSLARSGVDIIAPSDMMDGRVGAIRAALDGAGSKIRRFFPMPRSSLPVSMARSARRPIPRRSSETAVPTRWTRPTFARRCGRSSWILKRART